jgi:hypothetical protein
MTAPWKRLRPFVCNVSGIREELAGFRPVGRSLKRVVFLSLDLIVKVFESIVFCHSASS